MAAAAHIPAGSASVAEEQRPAPDPSAQPLPALRDDLHLLPGPRAADGAPTWTIFDPVRHRYHRLSLLGFDMLSRWDAETAGALADRLAAETLHAGGLAQIEDFIRFLRVNGLVDLSGPRDREGWVGQARAGRAKLSSWLLHNYLFFRIPLVRPDRFLAATWPFVRWLNHRATAAALGAVLCLALYLVARQWDAFVGGLAQFSTVEGLTWTAVTLVLTKVVHELGHAYIAHRFGCRVPTMGVAFMVLFPVLYTDTSDSWRLTDRKARLAVGVAGIVAELGLAVMATLLWSFLPDGSLRDAVYIVATASWVSTLLINLSPFMRFDGYYLLSDAWDIPNLQTRAFALARWRLREALFGFGEPPPEAWPAARRRALVAYAMATWLYRLILFLGIAVMVYHFFIKVVGIVLFAVEILWFIGRPVWSELRVWWGRRNRIRLRRRTVLWLALMTGLLTATVVPLRTTVPLPAIWMAAEAGTVHAPRPGRIAEVLVARGDIVEAGQPLLRIEDPDLAHDLAAVAEEGRMTRLRLQQAAVDRASLADRLVLQVSLDRLHEKARGLDAEAHRMILRAPVAGRVTDLERTARPGRWVSPELPLVTVVAPEHGRIVAYADEFQAPRLTVGEAARFHPDDPLLPPVPGAVAAVAPVNVSALPDAYLSADQGGPLGVRPQAGSAETPVPVDTLYRVDITVAADNPAPPQIRRGIVRVSAHPESLLARAWRTVVGVFIRESSF